MDKLKMSATFTIPAKDLYKAWLDSKKHSAMTGADAVVSAKANSKHSAWDGYIWGKTVEVTPGKKIVQTWRTSDFAENDLDSLLEIDFSEKKGKTTVTLMHTNIPKGQGKNYKKGWVDYYFAPMKNYFTK